MDRVDDDVLAQLWGLIATAGRRHRWELSGSIDGVCSVTEVTGDSPAGRRIVRRDPTLDGLYRAMSAMTPPPVPATTTWTVESSRVGTVAEMLARSVDRWAADVGAGVDVDCPTCQGSGASTVPCGCVDADSSRSCQRCDGRGQLVNGCWWCAATGRRRTAGNVMVGTGSPDDSERWLDVDASTFDVVNARVAHRRRDGSVTGWNEWRLDISRAARSVGVQLPALVGVGDLMRSVADQHTIGQFQPISRFAWRRTRRKHDLYDRMCRRAATSMLQWVPAGAHPGSVPAWWLPASRADMVLAGCEYDRLGRVVTTPATVWPTQSTTAMWFEVCRFAQLVAVELGSGWSAETRLTRHVDDRSRPAAQVAIVATHSSNEQMPVTVMSVRSDELDAAIATLLWRAQRTGVEAAADQASRSH